MGTKRSFFIIVFSLLLVVSMAVDFALAKERSALGVTVQCSERELLLQVRSASLGSILDALRRECQVEIVGLDDRRGELVTFSSPSGNPHTVLKRFLRHLGEKNYSFQFLDERLSRIFIFPEEKGPRISSPVRAQARRREPVREEAVRPEREEEPLQEEAASAEKEEGSAPKEMVSAVSVQGVVDDTQAESMGLSEGDVVLEYDGVKITNAQQLVQEVKKRADKEQVEMVVLRDNQPVRLSVKGGYIGVRVKNIQVPKEQLGESPSKE